MSAAAASVHRFVLSAKALNRGTVEHEALEQYPWPLPLRLAGYITAVCAVASMLAEVGVRSPAFIPVLVLSALFVKGFHVLSQAQCLSTPQSRYAVLLGQIVVAVVLLGMSFCMGSVLLLYIVAAELQFVFSFRTALLLTGALLVLEATARVRGGVNRACR